MNGWTEADRLKTNIPPNFIRSFRRNGIKINGGAIMRTNVSYHPVKFQNIRPSNKGADKEYKYLKRWSDGKTYRTLSSEYFREFTKKWAWM